MLKNLQAKHAHTAPSHHPQLFDSPQGVNLPQAAFAVAPQLRLPGRQIVSRDDLVDRMITFMVEDLLYPPFGLNGLDCKISSPREYPVSSNVVVLEFIGGKKYTVTIEDYDEPAAATPEDNQ